MGRVKNPCPGAGQYVALSWFPDDAGSGYPGAAICPVCSGGIMVKVRSVRMAKAQDGTRKQFGVLRQHNKVVS